MGRPTPSPKVPKICTCRLLGYMWVWVGYTDSMPPLDVSNAVWQSVSVCEQTPSSSKFTPLRGWARRNKLNRGCLHTACDVIGCALVKRVCRTHEDYTTRLCSHAPANNSFSCVNRRTARRAKTGLAQRCLIRVCLLCSQKHNKAIGDAQIMQRIRFGCRRQGCSVACNGRVISRP